MSDFVRVLGKLPGQKNETGFFFINRVFIKAIYPWWAVKDKTTNKYSGCPRTHPGAELPFCKLIDMENNELQLFPNDWDNVITKHQIDQMKRKEKDEEERAMGFAAPPRPQAVE
jgi:hypothetical protein